MKEQDNDKIRSIIKLGLWLTFISVIIIVANFGGNKKNTIGNVLNNNNNKQEEAKVITYEEKWEKLNDNYKYNYEVNVGGNIYNYVGMKLLTKESGYRLEDNVYLYYFVDNGIIYEVKDGKLYDLETLYENIDVNNLDVSKLKENISNKEYVEENNKYSYLFENNKTISVYTDSENIIKIEENIDDDYYKLEFTDIGLVEEIKY